MHKKTLSLAFLPLLTALLSLIGCLGSDPRVEASNERSRAMCVDGVDNDGDGHYDCYDPDCRIVQDSLWSLDITDTICHYEKLGIWIAPLSSSIKGSSSSTISSSANISSSSAAAPSFPLAISGSLASDSVQVFAVLYHAGKQALAVAGKYGTQGLFGVIDTNTVPLLDFEPIATPEIGGEMETGSPRGRYFIDIDTNKVGLFNAIGSSDYTTRTLAMALSYNYESNPRSYSNNYAPHDQLIFSGYNTPSSECMVTNHADTGFVLVDVNINDNVMASASNFLPHTSMAHGIVAGTNCAGIGTRSKNDSTQIWLLITNHTNSIEVASQVSTGTSANEVAYDLVALDSLIYVAAKVDNQVRLLIYDAKNDSLFSAGSAQGPGTPSRLRAIKSGGQTQLLLVGSQSDKGALWLFNTSGALVSKSTVNASDAHTLSDVTQLPSGALIAGGWKADSGGGTTGVLLKLNTALNIIP